MAAPLARASPGRRARCPPCSPECTATADREQLFVGLGILEKHGLGQGTGQHRAPEEHAVGNLKCFYFFVIFSVEEGS